MYEKGLFVYFEGDSSSSDSVWKKLITTCCSCRWRVSWERVSSGRVSQHTITCLHSSTAVGPTRKEALFFCYRLLLYAIDVHTAAAFGTFVWGVLGEQTTKDRTPVHHLPLL